MKTLSSREFHQDSAGVLRAAATGPVYVTRRGERRFVITTIEDYDHRGGSFRSLADALGCPDPFLANIEDPPPRSREIDPRDIRMVQAFEDDECF
jgi:prevent-host-death family protein